MGVLTLINYNGLRLSIRGCVNEYNTNNCLLDQFLLQRLLLCLIFTKLHKKYRRDLEIERDIHCYIQFLVQKKTFETISIDFRRYQGSRIKREQELNLAVERLYADCEVVKEEEEVGKANKQ